MAPFAPLPAGTKKREDAAGGAPLRSPRPGAERGTALPGFPPPLGRSRAARPGARKPAGRMLTRWGEGGKKKTEREKS